MMNDIFGIRLIRLAPFQGLVTELHDFIGRCPMLLLARLSALWAHRRGYSFKQKDTNTIFE
jgi:hypothetical protein